jgi:hypothetical protein
MFLPHDELHRPVHQTRSGDDILLHPRPRTHPEIKFVLVPLLPTPKCVPLPGEIWRRILRWIMQPEQDPRTAWEGQRVRLALVRVCKSFKVSPLSNGHLASVTKRDLTGCAGIGISYVVCESPPSDPWYFLEIFRTSR